MKSIERRVAQLEADNTDQEMVYLWRHMDETDQQFAERAEAHLKEHGLRPETEIMQIRWHKEDHTDDAA